ncbi:uncharacterized protein A4U43_C08F32270 [Asparagus officinalis]|nr:uncharacterized protein A4U43_C08F32270 [Asparagus officinalis]
MSGCGIRALWVLNTQDAVVFSKEGSARGFGIRVGQSAQGSDSWIDDPITRHIITLRINRDEGDEFSLWPLVLHIKGGYCIIILPLVEPQHYKSYERMCSRSDCGNLIGLEDSLSSLLLDLPCITGAFMVAHAIGDIVTGDLVDPEVIVSSSPSVGGLLDSLTGSIGITSISARAKPIAAPVAGSSTSSASTVGSVISDAPRSTSKPVDKEVLRSFISSSMPFGTPLDLNISNNFAIRMTGFSTSDLPPADLKQPAWKPYLYKGRQRILFTIHETIYASMYDREEILDAISVSGQVNCRAELEGLPDVSFPLMGLRFARVDISSFHHCAQVSEQGVDKQSMMFSPPLGNFVLMRYQALCSFDPPVKGFYQLSMVSEDEGAFLFRLRLMEGYKSPLSMDFCTVTMPFPRRRVASFDGIPSIGTVSMSEHSVEWKIIITGRGITGKSLEAAFSGTIRFFPRLSRRVSSLPRSTSGIESEEDSDSEEGSSNNTNMDELLMEKMTKDVQPVDLEEPFCWQAYNYAKVSFKILGGTLSGMSIDPKSVSIYPAVKAPVESTMQVSSGDYILWNTLGRCPFASSPQP